MTPSMAETLIPVNLDRERFLRFNANTMSEFERVSGKFYWDAILGLFNIYDQVGARPKPEEASLSPAEALRRAQADARRVGTQVLRKIPNREVHQLVYAACHEYNEKDDPVWPLSLGQIGRLLKPLEVPTMLSLIIRGHTANSPSQQELGEALAAGGRLALVAEGSKAPVNGGAASSALPEDAFG